jgi:spore germination cell wall hydrolase CwlJ-like protein
MKMITILGGVASSAVIFASAFIYSTAERANAAVEPIEVVYVDRVLTVEVERVVTVPVPARGADPEAIFADATDEERLCLAKNIYFEARGESLLGQEFVAWVTLNRVQNSDFPNDICAVIWQSRQFSWTHDGKSDEPKAGAAWTTAQMIADDVIHAYGVERDPTEGSTYFHADYVTPAWAKRFDRVVQVDRHIFYADNG